MFPCSTLQKPVWNSFFLTGQDTDLQTPSCVFKHRCSIPCKALARPARGAQPWQFPPTASFHWEKDAQERLSRTSLFLQLLCSEKNYLTKQVTSPAVAPLLTCSFLPLPRFHASPILWPLSTFLSQIYSKNIFSLSASFPCYSAPEPQLILYPLLWPCWTQRARALGLAELCLKHKENLEAERVKFISSNSNLLLILRSKRSFFLTWITGIGSEVMPLWYPGLP